MPPPASLSPAARRFRGVAAALASSSPVPPAADHRRRLRLSGKVAAVTGGASGIGEAAVRLFVEEGAAVAFCDRDGKRGDAIASELRNAGARVLFVQVSSTGIEAECARFVAETVAEFGSLSILVNNAAVRSYLKVTEATEDSWDEIWSVNVKGYAFCSKAAIPTMASTGGGSIVNVASHRALVAGPKTVQYDTTKAAVAGLTRSMARDHAEDGVRVNSVAPGPTMTRFHELRLQEMEGVEEDKFLRRFAETTMLQRVAQPREIAHAILWLASDDSSFATGSIVVVDGGASANSGEGYEKAY